MKNNDNFNIEEINIDEMRVDKIKVNDKKKYYDKKYEKIQCSDCGGSYMRTNKKSHYRTQKHIMKSNITKLTNSLNRIQEHVQISLET
jgi:hypothetical protein